MTEKKLLEIRGLRATRGEFELDVPEWHVSPGQIVGLVGPNGSGKTTLLEIITGLREADAGSVSVFGRDPSRDPVGVRSQLGYMSDDTPLFAMKVGDLLRMTSGYYPTWDDALVDELVGRFRLDTEARVWELSKGQGVRIRLVLALAFRPRLVLLDEPAAGLDLAGRRALLETTLEVLADDGRSVIISSHLLNDVERIADRLLVLNEGQVVKEGPIDALVDDHETLEEALLGWGAGG